MAVFLDAVASSATMNSYATIAEADTFLAGQLYGDAWADVEGGDDQKAQALITATRLLDENIVWLGWPTSYLQPLGWPRSGVLNRNGSQLTNGIVAVALKNATAAFALWLIGAGELPNTGSANPTGLKRLKAGTVDLEFNESLATQRIDAIPVHVYSMINFLIEGRSQNVLTSVPLVRM